MPELEELLAAYRAGDAEVQRALLEEFEPLLFGYLRSLATGPDAHERAVRQTHELVLAFHLMASEGDVRLRSVRDLKRHAHALATAKRAGFLVGLPDYGDPETGALAPRARELAARARAALDPTQLATAVDALLGRDPPPADWEAIRAALSVSFIA